MKKPKGHVAGAQRYSARLAESTQKIQVLYLGAQANEASAEELDAFQALTKSLFSAENGPDHFDYASYVDPQGVPTFFATAYWTNPDHYRTWASCAGSVAKFFWVVSIQGR